MRALVWKNVGGTMWQRGA
uniref:Uncharacterized protein n=1 Tax=Arundo donax TaxID=35708 RepID=A0A0A8YFQ5_ARUDO